MGADARSDREDANTGQQIAYRAWLELRAGRHPAAIPQ
jgi:hypothetical protein